MLEVSEKRISEVTVLNLKGKITIGAGDVALRNHIEDLVENGRNKIVLNMARVSYIDSSGTGELVSCYTKVAKAGGKLKLLNISQKIQDILQIAQLFSIFDIFTDEAEAVGSYLEG